MVRNSPKTLSSFCSAATVDAGLLLSLDKMLNMISADFAAFSLEMTYTGQQ